MGQGQVTTRVPRNENLSVMAEKEGFTPVTKNIGTELSTTGICDLIGGSFILIPFFGLLFPGAHQLKENNVSMVLQEESKTPSE